MILSYNVSNQKRDMTEPFQDMLVEETSLIALLSVGDAPVNNKKEWLKRQIAAATFTVASFDSDGDGTGINFVSNVGLAVGDVLHFVSATGQDRDEVMYVAAVDAGGTDTTLTRDYASSAGATLVVGDVAKFMRPNREGRKVTDLTAVSGTAATPDYNYVQIASRLVEIAKSAEFTGRYGTISGAQAQSMLDEIRQQELSIMWEMTTAFINGYRYDDGTGAVGRLAGGAKQFITAAGNVTDAGGAAITLAMINAGGAQCRAAGAKIPPILAMHSAQKQNMSDLNSSGTNPITMVSRDEATAGTIIEVVQSNIEGVSRIYLDDNMPTDMIIGINPEFEEINYAEPMSDVDGSVSDGDDVIARLLRTKFTFSHYNGLTGFIIKKLAV